MAASSIRVITILNFLFLILVVLNGISSLEKKNISLDTLGDLTSNWTILSDKECFYDDDLTDFENGWGCGGPESDNWGDNGKGYWSPCKVQYCSLVFYNESFKASEIFIKGFVKGNAVIRLATKVNPTSISIHVYDLKSGDTGLFAGNVTIDMSGFQEARVVEIRLISATDGSGYALLDEVILSELKMQSYESTTESSAVKLSSKLIPVVFTVIYAFNSF